MACGLPGSGMSRLARRLEDTLHAIRCSPDEGIHALLLNIYHETKCQQIELYSLSVPADVLFDRV